ncbi:hypothetical protein FDUTEX481_01010 [Tolypothrix sp. PCC 7601]|nr:hypothetical protein FDUTEX481_01010 [Tolypothrix sp. PCC 7601]
MQTLFIGKYGSDNTIQLTLNPVETRFIASSATRNREEQLSS